MSSIVIIDDSQLKKLQEGLKKLPNDIATVTSRAINKSLDVMRTSTWRNIKPEYNVSQGELYKYITLVKSSVNKLTGAEVVIAPHIPLITSDTNPFKVKPGNPMPAIHPTVTFQVRKGVVENIPGSFVAIMPSGHRGLFVRDSWSGPSGGGERLPISQKFTIGMAEMVGARRVRDKVEKDGHDTFMYEFGRQADMTLKKAMNHKK